MKGIPPAPGSPLEWWEKIQINMVESLGFPEEAAHFREHPDAWREYREKLRERINQPPTSSPCPPPPRK